MKQKWKRMGAGILIVGVLLGTAGTASATISKRTVEVDYQNITVTLNGEQVNLVDVKGNPVEPFVISGTTYLPVRAVAEALGLDVDWDGATATVILTGNTETSQEPTGEKLPQLPEATTKPTPTPTLRPTPQPTLPPVVETTPSPTPEPEQEQGLPSGTVVNLENLTVEESKYRSMLTGKEAPFAKPGETVMAFNRLILSYRDAYEIKDTGYAIYSLNEEYRELNGQFDIKLRSKNPEGRTEAVGLAFYKVDAYGTETLLQRYFVKNGEGPIDVHIDLTGVEKLKIVRLPSKVDEWPYERTVWTSLTAEAQLYNVTLTVK